MRSALVVLVLVVACTKATEKTPESGSAAVAVKPVPVKDGIAIPANHPTTNILVTNHCSLSPHPPSTYFWSDSTIYDLEAATWTRTAVQGNEGPPEPDPAHAPKVTKTNGTIDADRVARMKKHLAELLAGGPYAPKYPFSGGSRCTLMLTEKGQDKPFFQIDRADNEIDDVVKRLMTAQ